MCQITDGVEKVCNLEASSLSCTFYEIDKTHRIFCRGTVRTMYNVPTGVHMYTDFLLFQVYFLKQI
jgi:hypothetical protein